MSIDLCTLINDYPVMASSGRLVFYQKSDGIDLGILYKDKYLDLKYNASYELKKWNFDKWKFPVIKTGIIQKIIPEKIDACAVGGLKPGTFFVFNNTPMYVCHEYKTDNKMYIKLYTGVRQNIDKKIKVRPAFNVVLRVKHEDL